MDLKRKAPPAFVDVGGVFWVCLAAYVSNGRTPVPSARNGCLQLAVFISCNNALDSLIGVQQVADGGIVV